MSAIATVIARSVNDEAIQRSCCGATGLLRYARNDGRFNIFSALSTVIVREGGRSSIPETTVINSISRGVLDAPRGMTAADSFAVWHVNGA
jgi:hypothetical protein